MRCRPCLRRMGRRRFVWIAQIVLLLTFCSITFVIGYYHFVDENEIVISTLLHTNDHTPHECNRSTTDRVHIFYYPWYGNPIFDQGKYYHWNHRYIPHWDIGKAARLTKKPHSPPLDIGSLYYPALGIYSSRDQQVINQHMAWIAQSGVGVVVVSWYPKGLADDEGRPWDDLIPTLLNAADAYHLKIALHIEPYKNRSIETVSDDIRYIIDTYANHNAFYRRLQRYNRTMLPMIYPTGNLTIRRTPYDAIVIGLIVQANDKFSLLNAGFDGFYTYFASDHFTYGSTPANWPALQLFAKRNGMLFIPSIGAGYDDTRIRPWNNINSRDRQDGQYMIRQFNAVMNSRGVDSIISITSFNEWHESTQIEPAIAMTDTQNGFEYKVYNEGPYQYLTLVRQLIAQWLYAAGDNTFCTNTINFTSQIL